MTRSVLSAVALCTAVACFMLPPAPPAGGAVRPSVVRIGLVGSLFRDMPEPVMKVLMAPFRSLLELQTGMTGELVAGGDAACLGRKLKEEQVHFGVFHGFEFAWARLKNPDLKPLVLCVNGDGTLRAQVVVRDDGPVTKMGDLRGCSVALPRFSREHCRLFLERRCTAPGCAPAKFFSKVTTPDAVEDALDDVVDGRCEAAVVDGLALEAYRKFKPGCAGHLRTLAQSELFPPAVVAYQPGILHEELIDRFREGMLAANATERGKKLMELCRITAFRAVPDDYDHMLESIAKAYPPPAAK
jgi:ABC-type phosphate/phosphonate transport system substrate-binding protein